MSNKGLGFYSDNNITALQAYEEEAEEKDLLKPQEISITELDKFAITVNGFKFYQFGSLVCSTCGKSQIIRRITLPDETYKWYLIFTCKHYKASEPAPQVEAATTPEPQQ